MFVVTRMRSALLSGVCLVGMSVAAFAADLPSRKAPAGGPLLPVFTWTGFYIGFNYGYAWKGDASISTAATPLFDTNAPAIWAAASALGASGSANSRLNGFFGGAQAGFNWQFANALVAGLEADIQAGGVSGGGWFGSVTPAALPGSVASTSVSLHRTLEHFGTLRGRIGYAVKPGTLAYVTGGLAFGGVATKVSINQSLGPSLMAAATPKADHFEERVGWALGAGAEMAISPNLSAKLEYLYYDLGVSNTTSPYFDPLLAQNPITGAGVAAAMTAKTRFNGHILRTGVNYRFGGQSGPSSGLPSLAIAAAEPPRFGDWSVLLMPYVWGLGMNGTTTVVGQTVKANASFPDFLTKTATLPLAFMAYSEIRNGPLSLYSDFVWSQIRLAGSVFSLTNPIAGLSASVDADAKMKTRLAVLEAGGALELTRWGYAGAPAAFTAIDAVLGARYWRMSLDVAVNLAFGVTAPVLGFTQVGGKSIAKSGKIDWIDPFFGFRIRQQVDPHNSFYVKADVGGFGLGSRIAWQGAGGYAHDFEMAGHKWTATVGYRALYADYSQGEGRAKAGVTMVIHGPTTGLGVKF